MKKHILAVLLAMLCLVLVLSLASCGVTTGSGKDSGDDTNSDTNTNTETGTDTDTESNTETETDTNTETETDTNTDTSTECVEHDFSEWSTVTEATCAAAGLEKSSCSVCGVEEEREIPKTENHSWSDWTTTGGCASDGEETRSCSVCQATESKPLEGHPWTDWGYYIAGDPFIQEATCKAEGYEGRMCSNCGIEETRPIPKLSHKWGGWTVVEGDCVNGATRTRACTSCGDAQSQTIEPGEHANIVYEGAKAPTATEDGSTGVKICKSCGDTLEPAKVVRIVNMSSNATVTSNAGHWQVIGNGGWAVNTLPYLTDGKYNTGTPSCAQTNGTQWFMLTFDEAINLNNIVIVCNGSGNVGALGDKNDTNCKVDVTVIFLDENGEILSKETKNTADVTSISFENNTENNVKQIQVSYPNNYKSDILYIWEIETYAIKELTVCEVAGSHTWGDWETEVEPTCSQEGLINGKSVRTCTGCGEIDEEEIEATHSFGEWIMSDLQCLIGGTKTRECSECHLIESEVIEEGGHIDVVIEDAIEPTFEAEGSTGKTVCKACGATIEEAKTISKLVYVEDGGTVTTSSTFWASSAANIQKLIDGNRETGVCSSSNGADGGKVTDTIAFKEESNVKQVVLVVNGKGNTTEGKSYGEVTNINYAISFTLYDVDGNAVFTSEKYQTLDQVEIVIDVDLPDGVMVNSMSILRETGYVNNTYLWEVEVIGGGVIQ